MHFKDEVLKHFLRHLEVSNHTVFKRTNRGDVTGCSAQHALGLGANGLYGLLTIVNSDSNN